MKLFKYTLTAMAIVAAGAGILAQDNGTTTSGPVRRRAANEQQSTTSSAGVTERMQDFYSPENSSISDADRQWQRVIYRQIDLEKDQNAPLYFPEEPIDGQENLFRIIMRLLADNQLTPYEYLDGREVFTEKYVVPVRDILDRFHIIYQNARGYSERNPKYTIDESDVPCNEVLSYYIIEQWDFDTRSNRLRPTIEAICPVLHRSGDFGGEAVRYPMFWVKYSDLRPYLAQQTIFVNDNNNLPTCTYDDFFNLTMYDGEIYKTRNLKNKSMAQLYPDPDDRQRAQDSIQASLTSFESKLWTPTREELIAAREAKQAVSDDSTATTDTKQTVKETTQATRSTRATRSTSHSSKKPSKIKESQASKSSSAARSVRRRK